MRETSARLNKKKIHTTITTSRQTQFACEHFVCVCVLVANVIDVSSIQFFFLDCLFVNLYFLLAQCVTIYGLLFGN